MIEFLQMGDHGFYVWTSYAIALIVLLFNLVLPIAQQKKRIGDLRMRGRRKTKAAAKAQTNETTDQ